MPFNDPAPSATAPAAEHADWLELNALGSADRNTALADLDRAMKRAGTADALKLEGIGDPAPDKDEQTSAIAQAAFDEIETRERSCGSTGAYAFTVGKNVLEAKPNPTTSIYVFLLLLAQYGHLAAKSVARGDALLEEIAAAAVRNYLGGAAAGVQAKVFGPARRKQHSSFKKAVDGLCTDLGEGGGISDQPSASDRKDAKLDIVAWTPFADGRKGKVVAFGQCASGANWKEKLTELLPKAFCGLWFREPIHVEPTRFFFMPFTIPDRTWDVTVANGGIVFDRCRLAAHAAAVPADVAEDCRRWSEAVLGDHVLS